MSGLSFIYYNFYSFNINWISCNFEIKVNKNILFTQEIMSDIHQLILHF